MNPGIFVVASDCIELFNSEGDWSLTKPGFTALAHPSPVIIGTTHGVFVLADHEVKTHIFAFTLTNTICGVYDMKQQLFSDIGANLGSVKLIQGWELMYSVAYFM